MTIYPTHTDAIPVGMLIDCRQQARPVRDSVRGLANIKWREEWDSPAREAALSGQSAAQIAGRYGVSINTAQLHLAAMGLIWAGRLRGWVDQEALRNEFSRL